MPIADTPEPHEQSVVAEVAALEADQEDRAEMLAVAELIEKLHRQSRASEAVDC